MDRYDSRIENEQYNIRRAIKQVSTQWKGEAFLAFEGRHTKSEKKLKHLIAKFQQLDCTIQKLESAVQRAQVQYEEEERARRAKR